MGDNDQSEYERTQVTQDGQPIMAQGKAAEFAAGDIVGGAYEVLAFIGAGGMGNVYRVRHIIMNTEYALKTLSGDQVTEQAWRRFQNEAQAIARMNHPNVVSIYNLDLHEKTLPYYVMDLLRGETLLDKLRVRTRLPFSEALPIFVEACAGIGYAHKKGIVHRDIKPGNIVILDKPDASGAKIKIVDFGIAKLSHTKDLANQQLTGVGEICGSPFYMSPEQSQAGKIDARSDIYSLGCTLFETLTGSPPFRGRNATETIIMHHSNEPPTLEQTYPRGQFDPDLEEVVATCLAKVPMDRYQNMESLARELQAVGRKEAGEAEEQRTHKGKKISPVAIMATVIALLVAAAGAVFWLNGQIQHPNVATAQTENASKVEPTKLATEVAKDKLSADPPPPTEAQLTDPRPYCTIISPPRAVPIRHFEFPTDRSLGRISLYWNRRHTFDCRGTVEFPANIEIHLAAGRQVALYPQLLDRFNPTDLFGIELSGDESRPFDDKTIKHLSRFTRLFHLSLIYCDKISKDSLPTLDGMKSLISLDLSDNKQLTVAEFSRTAMIHRLQELTAKTDESLTPLFAAMKGQDKLQFLDVAGQPLQPIDYTYIGTFSKMNTFKANSCGITDEEMQSLSNLRNLQSLEIDSCEITEKSAPIIQKILTHPPRFLRIDTKRISAGDLAAIKSKLKGIQVN